MNNVHLIGRLTKNVELRYTNSGIAVGSFTLAVTRDRANANGEHEADFINMVIWQKAAENFAQMTGKGAQVGIDGRITTRSYENAQGQRVYMTEVVVEKFTLLETKAESEARRGVEIQHHEIPTPDPTDPFATGTEIDITDDDLPF
jgi:single-strand DNA-binding protein